MLAEAAVPYTYECIGADLWTPQLKAQFTFGMLPVLANFDGRGGELCNSQVITRHIARSVGLAGWDDAGRRRRRRWTWRTRSSSSRSATLSTR